MQPLLEIDTTTLIAIGGFILGLASGIAQLIKIIKDARNADSRLPIQNKLDESQFAKNSLETANLATEARLKLEEHTLMLDKRIEELEKAIDNLEKELRELDRKNSLLLKTIGEFLYGIKILISQLKELEITPGWNPKITLKDVIEEQEKLFVPEKEKGE